MRIESSKVLAKCFHCGEACNELVYYDDKPFCCMGCKTVYEILDANNLCAYYQIDDTGNRRAPSVASHDYDYLDDATLRRKLLSFESAELSKVVFKVPSIHCASCVWLLENLSRINPGIIRSEIIFGKKTVTVEYNPSIIKLSAIASLLADIGYSPDITIGDEANKRQSLTPLILKLAIAGFCFGNIMLFSFPEYLGLGNQDPLLKHIFSWLNLALSVPLILYSASDYFRSALNSFRQRQVNIDVPIAMGLLALFFRSAYDVLSETGPGYLDSLSGLVFFLLIGRWFQGKTYESLSFERDFKSYFPLAIQVKVKGEWVSVLINELTVGDTIRVRNMEIVPADSIVLEDHAYFDYSFITGEAKPVEASKGKLIYAGARRMGRPVTMTVEKISDQSHLTGLWNNINFKKKEEHSYRKVIDRAAKNFSWIVMIIAAATWVYWYVSSAHDMWLVFTSVLMVACPCALALAAPFTFGSMLRVFGRHKFYLKNADVIEKLANIDVVVFDKTGTITHGKDPSIEFFGALCNEELAAVKILTDASTHPLSMLLSQHLTIRSNDSIRDFKEFSGKGIQGFVGGKNYKIGSAEFVAVHHDTRPDTSYVFIAINDHLKGYFSIDIKIRSGLHSMLLRLRHYTTALISGDNESDREKMQKIFPASRTLLFNQDPYGKLEYIKLLQANGQKVLMIGDGLNDSGALRQSDVGIAVTDNTGVFTPACDGIMDGETLQYLHHFLSLARLSTKILKYAFGISFFYNAIALSFAVSGHLTPLAAAILMPISSISVVGFSTLAVHYVSRRELGRSKNQESWQSLQY